MTSGTIDIIKRSRNKNKPKARLKNCGSVVKPFAFKDKTYEQMADELDRTLPIKLKRYNKNLIDRVCERCLTINKVDVIMVILICFQTIRELVVLKKILNFRLFLFDIKLFFFLHRKSNKTFPSLKLRVATPKHIRKGSKDDVE